MRMPCAPAAQSPQPTKLTLPSLDHERCPRSASRTQAFSVAFPAVTQHTGISLGAQIFPVTKYRARESVAEGSPFTSTSPNVSTSSPHPAAKKIAAAVVAATNILLVLDFVEIF